MWGLLATWLSVHNWTPLYYLPLVLEFFPTLLIPILFVALLLWLNVWPYHTCVILLDDIIDLNLLSLGTIVPAAPCYVFYMQQDIRFAEGLIQMTWIWLVIWSDMCQLSRFERTAPALSFYAQVSRFETILAKMSNLYDFYKSVTLLKLGSQQQ